MSNPNPSLDERAAMLAAQGHQLEALSLQLIERVRALASAGAAATHACSNLLAGHRADGCDAPEVLAANKALDLLEVNLLTVKMSIDQILPPA